MTQVESHDVILKFFLDFWVSGDVSKAVHVVIRVEGGKVYLLDVLLIYIHDFHFVIQIIGLDHLISHSNAERLHDVVKTQLVHSELFVIVITHRSFASGVTSAECIKATVNGINLLLGCS